jgi:hypothetical protein
VGYLALVERVPAGEEGTPIERRLVRVLVGPLPLEGGTAAAAIEHLRAVRIPLGAHVERLRAAGWVENAAGEVVAVAGDDEAPCPAAGTPGA